MNQAIHIAAAAADQASQIGIAIGLLVGSVVSIAMVAGIQELERKRAAKKKAKNKI